MFIVIEALDAGGSQTQTNLLVARLRKENHKVLQLHFPQEDRATGQIIYQKFLHAQKKARLSRREQTVLYIQDFFSRAEDIQAAIDNEEYVISDRFYTSTMAYQAIGIGGTKRKKLLAWIDWLCRQGTPALPKPEKVVFIDTPVAISVQHLKKMKRDYFEERKKLSAVRASYVRLAKEQHWIVINGINEQGKQRSKDDIHQEIWRQSAISV